MKTLIQFDEDKKIFTLTNDSVSYIMEIVEDQYLVHRFWGEKVSDYHFSNRPILKKRTFAASTIIGKPELSAEFLPFEFPFLHQGDYKNAAIQIQLSNQETLTRFSYQDYKIYNGAIELTDLPHVRNNDEKAQTLIIYLYDEIAKIELALYYTIFEHSPVIVRSTKVTNNGSKAIKLTKVLSASIDTYYEQQSVTSFYGTHQKEFQLNQNKISHGLFKIGSSRGTSGPQYPPYIAIAKDATESRGNVHAMTLLYSGNHEANLERDQYNQLRMQIGLNSDTFSWTLHHKETFQSPQAILVYSSDGFNGSSQTFQNFFTDHLIQPIWKDKTRPILVNSWEMSYFEVHETLMKQLIDSASDLGFETVVLDDGWFNKRNSSKTSLGDWEVDSTKFPNGIKKLVDYARKKDVGFGIWFEPEMISPNTKLIQEHPDWVMKSLSYQPLLGRNQYILDLTNKDVQQFIIDLIAKKITEFGVNYIKWDMNRHITEPFSQNYSFDPAEYSHRYVLGLYHIINELTSMYPTVLFENCSSGGGRLDPGMLFYFPQTWISDNTDGLDRQQIQYGASYLFPISSMTGHVSSVPNHQTHRIIPFESRAALASSTNMGYEMNIINLSTKDKEKIRCHLNEYKQDRALIMSGTFYRLLSPFTTNFCAWMFSDQEKEHVLIYFFRNTYQVFDLSLLLRIPNLDEQCLYLNECTQQIYSGSELVNCGLAFENPPEDFIVHRIKLKKVSE